MKVTKSVTLDEETARKAKEMDNFSGFIRDCMTSDLAFVHEGYKRRIGYLLEVIKIARDQGSQSKAFRDAVEMMIL